MPGKVAAGEDRACAGCCQGREEGRDSNVNLEIFWLPCFVACSEPVSYLEQGVLCHCQQGLLWGWKEMPCF